MAACAVLYCVEKYGFDLKERGLPRMFFNPAEIAMRIFGLPHFIVGLFFMLTSRRMKTLSGWMWFVGLLALGVGFAYCFGQLGGHRNPVMLIAFYFYFLIHGFRDEAYFYRTSGDCPAGNSQHQTRVVLLLQAMLISLVFAFTMPTYLEFLNLKGQLPADDPVLNTFFPASLPFLARFAMYLIPIMGFNLAMFWLVARRTPGGWPAVWRQHHPILVVFLGSTGIVLATLFVGPWTFNYVVLAHFVGWYLFAIRKLRNAPPRTDASPARPLLWVRTTVPGFQFLHLGLALVVTALIAVSVYGLHMQGPLEAIVGGPSFYYWTVIHVTLSFYPR